MCIVSRRTLSWRLSQRSAISREDMLMPCTAGEVMMLDMLMLLQALAQGGQRPSRDGMRRRQRAQEVRQVVGQRVELQPDGIGPRVDRALVPDIPARTSDQDQRPSGVLGLINGLRGPPAEAASA
jgi:hypothetical protein